MIKKSLATSGLDEDGEVEFEITCNENGAGKYPDCLEFKNFFGKWSKMKSRKNVIMKRALAAAQCVFIIDDRTQSMPIQSVVNVEAISSSTCIISTAPAADVLRHRR
uniref:Uncharacterized protein n=1 Tax=Rhodnius prolixus TaxID=13249 RepID=T1I781_RHOPR